MTLSRLTKMGFSKPLSAFLAFVIMMTAVPVMVLTAPQPAAAAPVLTNGTFQTNLSSWTYVNEFAGDVSQWTASGYANGGAWQDYRTGRNATGGGYLHQTPSSITAGSTVALSLAWQKTWTTAASQNQELSVILVKPDATQVTLWSNTTVYQASGWQTVSGLDVSSYFDQTGSYTLRLRIYNRNGNNNSARSDGYFDEVNLDVTAASANTTVGDGTDLSPGGDTTVGPGYTNQEVDAFTLATSTGNDTVTSVTFNNNGSSTSGNVGTVTLVEDAGTLGTYQPGTDTTVATSTFSGANATFSSLSLAVNTTARNFLVVYDITSSPTNGQQATGYVTAVAATNNKVYSDAVANSATLTVDASPPAIVADFNAADAEDSQSSLNWTNPADGDLAEVKVMRKTGSYPADHTDGTQVFDDTAAPFSETTVDNSPPLTNGQTYYYAIFVKDTYGNWNDTVTPGSNADTAVPAAQTTVGDGTAPSNKTVGPSDTNKAVDAFTLRTGSGADTVTQIQITGTNTDNVATDGVKLWRDNGSANNEWDATDTFITSGTASFSGTVATISGISVNVSTTPLQYLVTYNTSTTPTHGQTLTGYVTSATASNPVSYLDSPDATLTIDVQGATVTAADAYDATHVDITFSEEVDASSVGNPSLYSIPGLTVDSATRTAPTVVRLTTSAQNSGDPYTVTVTTTPPTVKDLYGNNLATPNSANFDGFIKTATLTGAGTAPALIEQGATDDFVRFSLTANGSTTLTAVRVDKLGNLPDNRVETVDLYKSGDQTFDGNDTKLASTTFSSGTSTLTVSEPVDGSVNAYYFIVMKMDALAGADTTIGARIPVNGFTVSGADAQSSQIDSGSATVTEAPDTVTVTYSNQAPRSASRPPSGATRLISMLKLDLSSAPKDSTMTAIKVDKLGSMAAGSISAVKIFASTNDQEYDPDDPEIASGDAGTSLTLTPSQSISAAAKRYFVVFEINSGAQLNDTVGAAVADQSYVTLAGVDVVKPFGDYNSKLITMLGEPHGSPQNPFAAGTNYCAACHSVHVAKQGRRLLEKLYTGDPAVVNTGDPEIYNALCFGCHDGSGSSIDVRSDYLGTGSVNQKQPTVESGETTSPGHMTDQEGTTTAGVGYLGDTRYDAETKLPCMVCHDVHQSRNGNQMMLADELYEFASGSAESTDTSTSSYYWDSSLSRWQDGKDTSDAAKRRSRCEVCHRNSSTGSVSDTTTSPGGGSWVDGKSVVVGIDLGRPESHNTGTKSTNWCGGCHGVHKINIDAPGSSGESSGGAACGGCHAGVLTAMRATSTYHHVMESDAAGDPADSSPAVDSGNRRCTMCHADHNVFSPAKNANGNRGKNLRTDIMVPPAANDTSTFSDTDFDYNAAGGSGGICLSCHQYAQAKDLSETYKQKDSGDVTTPILNKDDFNNAAVSGTSPGHNYEADSTFKGLSGETINKPYTFKANCVKCHNTMDQANYPYSEDANTGSKQDSTRRFQLHATPVPRLLAWLNIAEAGSQAALEEDFCVRCHSDTVGENPNTGSGSNNDYYGVATMNAASQAVKAMFSKTRNHPVGSTVDLHKPVEGTTTAWMPAASRHVECEDCHNPHAAKRRSSSDPTRGSPTGGDVGGPLKGVWGVTASPSAMYNTGVATFSNGTNLVNSTTANWATGGVVAGWYVKNNYDVRGRWYRITNVTNTQLTLASNYDGSTFSSGRAGTRLFSNTQYIATNMSYTKTNESTKQYEVCLKCHSAYAFDDTAPNTPSGTSYPAGSTGSTVRETDIGLDFNPNQLAHHAVLDKGKNQPIVPTGTGSSVYSAWNSNWPVFTTNQVTISTAGPAVASFTSGTNLPSTVIAGWYLKYGTTSPSSGSQNGWYQVTRVVSRTSPASLEVTPTPSGTQGPGAYALTAGLGNAFVPPYGPWSVISCDDCHMSDTGTDPEGPHGSAYKWVLRGATNNISFDWFSGGSTVQNINSANQAPTWNTTYSPKNLCINCHRRDVYGDVGGSGAFNNTNTTVTDANLSRVPHDVTANQNTYKTLPNWEIICMDCHGGDSLGGIHGTSAKKGLNSSAADLGSASLRGKRFLNGATWMGVTRASTTLGVKCYTAAAAGFTVATDEVNACGVSHNGTQASPTATYDYESAAD